MCPPPDGVILRPPPVRVLKQCCIQHAIFLSNPHQFLDTAQMATRFFIFPMGSHMKSICGCAPRKLFAARGQRTNNPLATQFDTPAWHLKQRRRRVAE